MSTVHSSRRGTHAWRASGDAFLERRLREIVGPSERAGAVHGRAAVIASRHGIASVRLSIDGASPAWPGGVREEPGLADVARLVDACLDAWQPAAAGLPLDLEGTPFQLAVWRRLREIRPGRTETYGGVARGLGRSPAASRAVGQAVGANPVPVLVPCHRVVASAGLGGFALGLEMKRRLLRAEGVFA